MRRREFERRLSVIDKARPRRLANPFQTVPTDQLRIGRGIIETAMQSNDFDAMWAELYEQAPAIYAAMIEPDDPKM